MRTNRRLTIAALALALPLSLAACGSSDAETGAASSAPMSSSAAPSPSESMTADTASMPFGPGCAAVPAEGAGSFNGMATDAVATAASNNPLLSTLVTAVGKAGLGETLNSAKDITVFAPTNDAFAALDKATMDKAMGDPKGLLTTVLTNHVVEGRLTPDMLAGEHKTLAG
ncbi:MAG TPA: fasciclin domain-containing protein, partial [Ornithinibacter sp.]|nr:fasciclin domain-containing protein [Ornithinibacter sp.]